MGDSILCWTAAQFYKEREAITYVPIDNIAAAERRDLAIDLT
jgi:hypothetical protein